MVKNCSCWILSGRQQTADTVEKVLALIPTWSVLKSICDSGIFGDGLSQFHLRSSRIQEFHSCSFAENLLERAEPAFSTVSAHLRHDGLRPKEAEDQYTLSWTHQPCPHNSTKRYPANPVRFTSQARQSTFHELPDDKSYCLLHTMPHHSCANYQCDHTFPRPAKVHGNS